MAHNEYYTYTQGRVNGKILMNVQVFDEITKRTVNEMKNVSLDTSKGMQIPGTKKVVNCSIKDNEVYICIHVRIKYGVNISSITKEENRAFKIAFSVLILMFVLLIVLLIPEKSLLRSPNGSLTTPDAPVMQAIVPILFLFLVIQGFIYGKLTDKFKTTKDFSLAMAGSVKNLASFLTFSFFCAQFLYVFGNSNVGTLIAISGAEFLKSLNMAPQITVAGITLLTALLNLLITSASSKWAILAPIFVPMLMAVGISPELTQAAFRVSDSAINVVTPMFAFYPLIISYCQKYCSKTGVGTLSSMMLPYSIGLLVVLMIMLYIFWGLNIPIGFNSGYVYPPIH